VEADEEASADPATGVGAGEMIAESQSLNEIDEHCFIQPINIPVVSPNSLKTIVIHCRYSPTASTA